MQVTTLMTEQGVDPRLEVRKRTGRQRRFGGSTKPRVCMCREAHAQVVVHELWMLYLRKIGTLDHLQPTEPTAPTPKEDANNPLNMVCRGRHAFSHRTVRRSTHACSIFRLPSHTTAGNPPT